MERTEVTLGIKPQVKQRPRMTRRGKAYTPARTKQYEDDLRLLYAKAEGGHYEGAVGVSITYDADCQHIEVWEIPEHENLSKTRGDLDNYIKATLDGLNGVAFDDDRQVKYIVARKL